MFVDSDLLSVDSAGEEVLPPVFVLLAVGFTVVLLENRVRKSEEAQADGVGDASMSLDVDDERENEDRPGCKLVSVESLLVEYDVLTSKDDRDASDCASYMKAGAS